MVTRPQSLDIGECNPSMTSLLKPEYFTEHVGIKAAMAGGLVGSDMLATFCTNYGGCTFVQWMPDLILILFGMMVLDMLTGVLKAGIKKNLRSRPMAEGMQRKIAIFAVVAATILVEGVFRANGLSLGGALYKWTTSWFIAVEALSLYENAQEAGVRIPTFLKEMTEKLLKRADHGARGYKKGE